MLSMERNEPNLNQSGYKFKFSAIAPIVILLTLSALIFFVVLYNGFADKNITELMGYFK